jgi:cellulose synthase/poly-beta-1,6-N-acetylglucosamine synthase-like glycosyltransferase
MYDRFRTHDVQAADARWLGSGNLVVSREAFDAVGGFDASLEVCEDVDLCSRLRRAGYRLVNDPALVSAHAGDPETLRALFKSELWRSRNNIQVTLRSDRSWRSLVSLAIPVLNLAAIATLVLAGLYRWFLPAALAAALTGALALVYTVVMLQRGRPALRVAVQAFVVASVYNLARSLALVWPAKHRRARPPKNLVAPEIR